MLLGHTYIGTEHVLLGLVREDEGVGARILLDFDADAEKISREVLRMLGGPQSQVPVVPHPLLEEIEKLRREKEAALEAQEFDKAAKLRDKERKLRERAVRHGMATYPPPRRRFRSMTDVTFPLLLGWVLFGVAFGIGLLVGIWMS
jgi:ATP-dependent Clp protease ATP-binding subunit ClpA